MSDYHHRVTGIADRLSRKERLSLLRDYALRNDEAVKDIIKSLMDPKQPNAVSMSRLAHAVAYLMIDGVSYQDALLTVLKGRLPDETLSAAARSSLILAAQRFFAHYHVTFDPETLKPKFQLMDWDIEPTRKPRKPPIFYTEMWETFSNEIKDGLTNVHDPMVRSLAEAFEPLLEGEENLGRNKNDDRGL